MSTVIIVFPKLFSKSETMQAHSKYINPNFIYFLIIPKDIIIIYIHINKIITIGFNMQTNLRDRFPINITKRFLLSYKAEQYIKVYSWEESIYYTYSFNLSTLAIGRFDIRNQFKKIEWLEET
ncbi:hypothetical protein EAE96_009799 [Botrytis aclada]|nr:hypothetical protein EAE96_009799 [Botrytis aclada]